VEGSKSAGRQPDRRSRMAMMNRPEIGGVSHRQVPDTRGRAAGDRAGGHERERREPLRMPRWIDWNALGRYSPGSYRCGTGFLSDRLYAASRACRGTVPLLLPSESPLPHLADAGL